MIYHFFWRHWTIYYFIFIISTTTGLETPLEKQICQRCWTAHRHARLQNAHPTFVTPRIGKECWFRELIQYKWPGDDSRLTGYTNKPLKWIMDFLLTLTGMSETQRQRQGQPRLQNDVAVAVLLKFTFRNIFTARESVY